MLLCRRRELNKSDFFSHAAYVNALKNRPQRLRLSARVLKDPGPDWDPLEYGPFPSDGLLLVYTR